MIGTIGGRSRVILASILKLSLAPAPVQTVRTKPGGPRPIAPELTGSEQKSFLDESLDFGVNNGLNSACLHQTPGTGPTPLSRSPKARSLPAILGRRDLNGRFPAKTLKQY